MSALGLRNLLPFRHILCHYLRKTFASTGFAFSKSQIQSHFSLSAYRLNVSGYTCPYYYLSYQNIPTLLPAIIMNSTQLNLRRLALTLTTMTISQSFIANKIISHNHTTIAHQNNISLIFKCNIVKDWITQFFFDYYYFSFSEEDYLHSDSITEIWCR